METPIYDPNEYFFTPRQKEVLLAREIILLNVEIFNTKVFTYNGDNILEDIKPQGKDIITFEDYKEIAFELIFMYSTYIKLYDKFNLNTENPVLDAEHILNMLQIGTENLPEFDNITLEFINSSLIYNLSGRIFNAFQGFLFSLEKLFPERTKEIKKLYETLTKVKSEDITDTSLFCD